MWEYFSYPVVMLASGVIVPWVWIVSNLLVAKLLGAPVQRAGLGLGPALLELSWGATACQLSWIPFGGSFALEPRPERSQVLRRMLLAFVGPLGVLFAATVTLFLLTWSDLPPTAAAAVVGRVIPGLPAEAAGLQPGDRVVALEGRPVKHWAEMRSSVGARAGRRTELTIERGAGETLTMQITPRLVTAPPGEQIGLIGILPTAPASQIGVSGPNAAVARAGLRTGDVILEINGRAVRRWWELSRALREQAGVALSISYVRPPGPELGWKEVLALPRRTAVVPAVAGIAGEPPLGLHSAELFVVATRPGAPAALATIEPGFRITHIDGKPVLRWRRPSQGGPERHDVRWVGPDGRSISARLTTAEVDGARPRGDIIPREQWVRYWALFAPPPAVPADNGPGLAWHGTLAQITMIWSRVWNTFFGPLRIEPVGGPLLLRSEEAAKQISALRYVIGSLLLLTPLCMLPLPPLPGGQLPLRGIELVRGRPLGRRTRLAATFLGVAVFFLLTLLAFSKDLLRFMS